MSIFYLLCSKSRWKADRSANSGDDGVLRLSAFKVPETLATYCLVVERVRLNDLPLAGS